MSRCKKMDLRRYHMISEICLTNDYRTGEDINKDDSPTRYIKLKKTLSFRKHFVTFLTEEIPIAKFCTEVFMMPINLMATLLKYT